MNKKITKTIAGILSGSILFESCAVGYFDEPADNINQIINHDNHDSFAVPLNIKLSNKDIEYFSFLKQLSLDIITNPSIANEFIKDPKLYIAKYGFDDKHIEVDSKLTKCILALGDTEISDAINNGDIDKYLTLLQQKNYIDKVTINNIDVLLSENNDIKIKNLVDSLKINEGELQASLAFFALAVVVGVAAVVWVAVIEHFGLANAVGGLTAVYWKVAAVTDGQETTEENKKLSSLPNSNVIQVWRLRNNDPKSLYLLADAYTSNLIESVLKYIKRNFPSEYDKVSENELRNAILINIQNISYE